MSVPVETTLNSLMSGAIAGSLANALAVFTIWMRQPLPTYPLTSAMRKGGFFAFHWKYLVSLFQGRNTPAGNQARRRPSVPHRLLGPPRRGSALPLAAGPPGPAGSLLQLATAPRRERQEREPEACLFATHRESSRQHGRVVLSCLTWQDTINALLRLCIVERSPCYGSCRLARTCCTAEMSRTRRCDPDSCSQSSRRATVSGPNAHYITEKSSVLVVVEPGVAFEAGAAQRNRRGQMVASRRPMNELLISSRRQAPKLGRRRRAKCSHRAACPGRKCGCPGGRFRGLRQHGHRAAEQRRLGSHRWQRHRGRRQGSATGGANRRNGGTPTDEREPEEGALARAVGGAGGARRSVRRRVPLARWVRA